MRMRNLLLTGWLFCLVCMASQAQDMSLVSPWAGCYALKIANADPAQDLLGTWFDPRSGANLMEPPRGFRLFENLDGKQLQPAQALSSISWPFSSWYIEPDGALIIGFSTGFVGQTVRMKETNGKFTGTFSVWTDTDATGPFPAIAVEINRIPCQ